MTFGPVLPAATPGTAGSVAGHLQRILNQLQVDGIMALSEQAKAEVAVYGIQRMETGGGLFPVPYRGRVPLSPFDNTRTEEEPSV